MGWITSIIPVKTVLMLIFPLDTMALVPTVYSGTLKGKRAMRKRQNS